MKKATKWIVRILKCLICLITGAYKDKDKDKENGNSHGYGNDCDGNRCNNAN